MARRSTQQADNIAKFENYACSINRLISLGLLTHEEARPVKWRLAEQAHRLGLVFESGAATPTVIPVSEVPPESV